MNRLANNCNELTIIGTALASVEMVPSLHNFITVDTAGFLSNPQNVQAVYNMCEKVFYISPILEYQCKYFVSMVGCVILRSSKKTVGMTHNAMPVKFSKLFYCNVEDT